MGINEERILDAALKIFISEGCADATTNRIAQEANVTERTYYKNFNLKGTYLERPEKRIQMNF